MPKPEIAQGIAQRIIDTFEAIDALELVIAEQKKQWKLAMDVLRGDLDAARADCGQMRLDEQEVGP